MPSSVPSPSAKRGIVYMLWGSYAQRKGAIASPLNNCILKAVHPSPLSVYRGFFGCRHFSQANEYLLSHGKSRSSGSGAGLPRLSHICGFGSRRLRFDKRKIRFARGLFVLWLRRRYSTRQNANEFAFALACTSLTSSKILSFGNVQINLTLHSLIRIFVFG